MKTLLLSLLLLISATAQASDLSTAAAALAPGSWVELPTNNMSVVYQPGGSDGNIFSYAGDAGWDPISRKVFYVANDHIDGHTELDLKFVDYDEASNTWQALPLPPFANPGSTNHGYYHHAVDPATGAIYRRATKQSNIFYKYLNAVWTALPPAPIETTTGCCGSIDFFPELGGFVLTQGSENNGGMVYLLNVTTLQWTKLVANIPTLTAPTHTIGAYSAVAKVLVFGQNGNFYKLDANRVVTRIANPPVTFYDGQSFAMVSADPVSGKFIVLSAGDRQMYSYDAATNIWQALASVNKPTTTALYSATVVPISTYGVTMYMGCYIFDCHAWLYKYAASSGPPPPPPPPPPPDTTLPLGPLTHDGPATPEQLALLLPVTGTLPQTATATVRYKPSDVTTWITGHPLFRIQPSFSEVPAVGSVIDAFAWPIINLQPGTSYDVEVTVTSGTASTVKTATFVTRALPATAGPANKTITTGSSATTIQAAFDALNPGDVIQFQDGTYNVCNLLIRRMGTALTPIFIRGASRAGVVISCPSRIIQVQQAANVIIENFTLRGSGVDSGNNVSSVGIEFFNGTPNQQRITVRNVTMAGVDRAISQFAGITETLVYDNTFIGNNTWTPAFTDTSIGWNDDGINLGGTGNVAFNNTLKGFGDCFSYVEHSSGVPLSTSRGIHFYRNDLRNCVDDMAEADHSLRNNSLYDNRSHNSMTFLSLDPLYGGPFLAARNIAINTGRTPFKWNSTNSGQFVFNNTIIRTTGKYQTDEPVAEAGWYQANNGPQRAYGYQNNILVYRGVGVQTIRLDNGGGHTPVDFSHNSWFPDLIFQWPEGRYSNLAAAFAGLPTTTPVFSGFTKRMQSDNITVANPWTDTVTLGSDYRTEVTATYLPTLATGSAPKNSGIAISNITDGFSGVAPDRGAVIEGRSAAIYGDRSNVDIPPPPPPTGDTTPPTITFLTPNGASFYGNDISVRVVPLDANPVECVQLFRSGYEKEIVTNCESDLRKNPLYLRWEAVGIPLGTYTLTAIATDAAGNKSNPATVMVIRK